MFPANQVLRSKSEVPAVARGHITSVIIQNASWGLTDAYMAGLLRPYSFNSYEEYIDFVEFADIESSPQYQNLGIKRLGWVWFSHKVGFTSNQAPLIAPDDFKGVKIRGLDGLVNAALIELGAAPVTMGGGEAFQALQTNLIDASVTTIQAVHQRRYFEVQDWCVAAPFYVTAFGIYVNEDWWSAQTPEIQAILEEETAALEAATVALADKELAELPDMIRASGMNYQEATPDQISAISSVAIEAWEAAYLEATGENGQQFLDRYRAWKAR